MPAVGELVRCTDGSWMTRPPQSCQVVGVHAGFIDTDMASAIPVSKMTPAEVAQRIVAGLEDGCRGGAHRRHHRQRQGCAVWSCGAPDLRIGTLTMATEEH
jgi:hypothetical protein